MTLLRERGYELVEERFTRDEAYIADEAFFTGTAAEVTRFASSTIAPSVRASPGRLRRPCSRRTLVSSGARTPSIRIGFRTYNGAAFGLACYARFSIEWTPRPACDLAAMPHDVALVQASPQVLPPEMRSQSTS